MKNTKNLRWFAEPNAPIRLSFNPYPTAGSQLSINLEIRVSDYFTHIRKITFDGFPPEYSNFNVTWSIDSDLPYTLNQTIQIPNGPFSIYPTLHIEGWNGAKYEWNTLKFRRPMICTPFTPIFDTRLAASNNILDRPKIEPIKKLLHISGFDTSTLGIEVQAPIDSGQALLDSEKEWASTGDCFIAILTRRHTTDSGEGLIPGWVHAESGLSYFDGRPLFAFVETGAKKDAIYNYLDESHIIHFDPNDLFSISDELYKITEFRKECESRKLGQGLRDAGLVSVGALAFIGIATIIDKLSGSKDDA